jgi:hypothetical protein
MIVGSLPVNACTISLIARGNSLFAEKFSLLGYLGNFVIKRLILQLFSGQKSSAVAGNAKFPCKFPYIREFQTETG